MGATASTQSWWLCAQLRKRWWATILFYGGKETSQKGAESALNSLLPLLYQLHQVYTFVFDTYIIVTSRFATDALPTVEPLH